METELIRCISDFENLVLDNFHGMVKGEKYRKEQWKIVEKMIKVGSKDEIEKAKKESYLQGLSQGQYEQKNQ